MPDLKVGESGDVVLPERDVEAEQEYRKLVDQRAREQTELIGLSRDRYKALQRASDAEAIAAKLKEQNRLLGERLHRLEAVTQSAFARSVRTLSSSRGQLGRSVEADRVVQLVEEHLNVTHFLDEHEVPGATLLQRVKWLEDLPSRLRKDEQFFAGVDLGFPEPDRTTIVEVRGEDVRVVDEHNPTIPAPALPPKP